MCEIIRNSSRWCRLNPISLPASILVPDRLCTSAMRRCCIARARQPTAQTRPDQTRPDQTVPYLRQTQTRETRRARVARSVDNAGARYQVTTVARRCGLHLKSATVTTYRRDFSVLVSRLITDGPRTVGDELGFSHDDEENAERNSRLTAVVSNLKTDDNGTVYINR